MYHVSHLPPDAHVNLARPDHPELTKASPDDIATLFLWGEIEEWLVIIAMSVPPVWPLFRQLIGRTSSTNSNRHFSSVEKGRTRDSGVHGTMTSNTIHIRRSVDVQLSYMAKPRSCESSVKNYHLDSDEEGLV